MWELLNTSLKAGGRFNNISVLIELCLSAPYANAILERFFNYMKIVKTDWRSKLNAKNLECLLRIRVEGPELNVFVEKYCSQAVDIWWGEKQRRLIQGERSYMARRKNSKRAKFNNKFIEEFLASSSSEDEG